MVEYKDALFSEEFCKAAIADFDKLIMKAKAHIKELTRARQTFQELQTRFNR